MLFPNNCAPPRLRRAASVVTDLTRDLAPAPADRIEHRVIHPELRAQFHPQAWRAERSALTSLIGSAALEPNVAMDASMSMRTMRLIARRRALGPRQRPQLQPSDTIVRITAAESFMKRYRRYRTRHPRYVSLCLHCVKLLVTNCKVIFMTIRHMRRRSPSCNEAAARALEAEKRRKPVSFNIFR